MWRLIWYIIVVYIPHRIQAMVRFPLKLRLKYRVYRYLTENKSRNKTEIEKILRYAKGHFWNLDMLSYEYTRKYHYKEIKVQSDEQNKKFVWVQGKKLYWKEVIRNRWIQKGVNSLLIEQDMDSPHRYLAPKEGWIIADIGAAEGIFALMHIEKAKKVYLFECDPEWISVLQRTFAPWKEKVEIIHKFVGKSDSDTTVTLDSFFRDKRIDYIKADIEGAEIDMLLGGSETFSSKIKAASICAYHAFGHSALIKNFADQVKMKTEESKGYILPIWFPKDLKVPYLPYFRKGVIYLLKRKP